MFVLIDIWHRYSRLYIKNNKYIKNSTIYLFIHILRLYAAG